MQRSFGRLCQPIRCASWTEASLLPVSCLRSAKVLPTGTGSHERSAIWPGVSSRNWAVATRSSKWTFEPLPERSIHGSHAQALRNADRSEKRTNGRSIALGSAFLARFVGPQQTQTERETSTIEMTIAIALNLGETCTVSGWKGESTRATRP